MGAVMCAHATIYCILFGMSVHQALGQVCIWTLYCILLGVTVLQALGQVPTRLAIRGIAYANDSEIPIAAVGQGGEESPPLVCFTSNPDATEWYFPNGSVVPLRSSPPAPNTIISTRQYDAITLHRGDYTLRPTDQYCCGSQADQKLCVNLVASCFDVTTSARGVTGDFIHVGSTVTYSCNDGYLLNGDSTRICQSSGMWSGPEALCGLISALPTHLGIGSINYTNGSSVPISAVGNGREGYPALSCFTENPTTAKWYFPNGSIVPLKSSFPEYTTMIVSIRQPGIAAITLHRGYDALSPTGEYCCDSETNVTQRLCISLGLAYPVYLSLSSTNYFTNNSEIEIGSIGDSDDQALVCHTDLPTCCRGRDGDGLNYMGIGEWMFPNGSNVRAKSTLSQSDTNIFYRARLTSVLLLHRRGTISSPAGTYCCVVPTSEGEMTFCANLVNSITSASTTTPAESTSEFNESTVPVSLAVQCPCTQPCITSDNTGAIIGGVVVLILGIFLILAITTVMITYLVLKHCRMGGVKRDSPTLSLSDKGQSVPQETCAKTMDPDTIYEDIIDRPHPLTGDYEFTECQAYKTNTEPLKEEKVVDPDESGNPTDESQLQEEESTIYEN